MSHVVRETSRCTIDIDTGSGRLFYVQRWVYDWLNPQIPPSGTREPPWTLPQKRAFHMRADRMVWNAWSNRTSFGVAGTSDFARRFAGRSLPINLDIQWVLTNGHWTVRASKVPDGYLGHPSRVDYPTRQIFLCTEDFERTRHANGIVAHEFGHSMGNTTMLNRGDEYLNRRRRVQSPHVRDTNSIMNIGRDLRARHFRTLVEEMNQMIPDTRFFVGAVR